MLVLHIQGGRRLEGVVPASGAKNAVLPLMAAALLTDEPITLLNVPQLLDVDTMSEALAALGVATQRVQNRLHINPQNFQPAPVSKALMNRMRASYYVIPALLARGGKAEVGMPGGCPIGARGIDLHLRAFRALGATVEQSDDTETIIVRAGKGGLRGGKLPLLGERGVSVGATCNALMSALLAEGETVIEGAAREPEVQCLAQMLRAMGAKIQGDGTNTIRIRGVKKLRGVEFSVIPDRIEAGTYLLAGAITGGCVTVTNCRPKEMRATVRALCRTGVRVREYENALEIQSVPSELHPINITTKPYPGFPTDLQSPFVALLTQAAGPSVIRETIFERRYQTAEELRDRMGAQAAIDGETLIVQGPAALKGAVLEAKNLRCGAALALAALAAEGASEIRRVDHIQRGYERFEEKLLALGAEVETRVTTDVEI